jgi:hypothetical protein
MTRLTWAVLVALCAALMASCGDSPVFPEDLRKQEGPSNTFREEPAYLRTKLLIDPWVSNIKVGNGRSTFGREVPRIIHIDIDGRGPLAGRDVSLQTGPSVKLFSGPGQERMRHALNGALQIVDRRQGFIRGINMSSSATNYEAAALAGIIEEYAIDGDLSKADRAFLEPIIIEVAHESAEHSYAWYDPRTTWVNFGPDVSNIMRRFATSPKRVTPAQGIFAAHVIRHEFEHSVSPTTDEDYDRFQWVEEGGADVFARWPGASAATAKAMGLPYPKKYEKVGYKPPHGGYPAWADTLFLLLGAAGIDVSDPKQIGAATRLLQDEKLGSVRLDKLARAIAAEQGLAPARARKLRAQVRALNGDPAKARRLLAAWL